MTEKELKDVSIKCVECEELFSFPVREQEFYKQKGFQWPRRCKKCREARKNRSGRNDQESVQTRHECVCEKCGEKTTVPFVPDGRKPVYCRDCYRESKKRS